MERKQIHEWLNKQNYQTEYEETGEYKMYFAVDMPKILNDFLYYFKNLPNEPKTVSNDEDKKKVCTHDCRHISQGVHKPVYCEDCGQEL